jgi:hypothetical protein
MTTLARLLRRPAAGALLAAGLLAAALAAFPAAGRGLNEYGEPEHGHGLTAAEAAEGWVSLLDGKTTFGWAGAEVEGGRLRGGATTCALGRGELRADVVAPGALVAEGVRFTVRTGRFAARTKGGPLRLEGGVVVRAVLFRPLGLAPLFNEKDLDGWERIDHSKLAKERQPRWEVNGGVLRAVGGPGALEYQGGRFGDLILQAEVRTRARYANGGLFFRCQPGSFMNGYEAQVHNRCEGGDVARPSRYATGGIDDRQNARRLVSRDGVPFTLTVIARGPHLATWVNGYQVTDWTDTRKKHDNPRQGLRTEPGTIQLQAHDPATDLEFRSVRVAAWPR